MRKLLLSTLALGLMLTGAGRLKADDLKPIVVVSLPSYDSIKADVAFVGEIADMPELSKQFDMAASMINGGQGIKGLDKTKPIGVAVMYDGAQPSFVAFIGATDLKALLGSLPPQMPLQVADKGDGTFEITNPLSPQYVVTAEKRGNWALLTNDKELLKSVPADPTTLLGGLDKDYAAAVRINVQNIPEQSRTMFTSLMKLGMQSQMQQKPGEDDSDFQLRKSSTDAIEKQIEEAINDLDHFTLGFAIDTEAKSVHLDAAVTFVAGSKLAKTMAEKSNIKSDFAGFLLHDAAVNMNFAQKLTGSDKEQLNQMLKTARSKATAQIENDPNLSDEATQKAAKELAGQLFDIGEAAVKSGKMDGGAALVLESKKLTFAAGGYLPNGEEVEKTFKKFVELGQAEPNFPPVKFDVEKYKDVHFDMMSIPINDEQAKQVFGETLDVYLGVGEHSAYVALGKGSIDLLKKIIDKSAGAEGESLPPFQLNFALTPIFEFINAVQPANPAATAIAQELAASGGKDHVKVYAKMIENGATYRFEAEEGVLRAVALAIKPNAK